MTTLQKKLSYFHFHIILVLLVKTFQKTNKKGIYIFIKCYSNNIDPK